MKIVKRCNDNVIALLIILPALCIRFAFQKIQFAAVSVSPPKECRKYPACVEGPSIPKGKSISFTAAD
jgi:hypothetical protein